MRGLRLVLDKGDLVDMIDAVDRDNRDLQDFTHENKELEDGKYILREILVLGLVMPLRC